MTLALLFWICMLLWLVAGVPWPAIRAGDWRPAAGSLLLFILFLCVGWHCFGAPIK